MNLIECLLLEQNTVLFLRQDNADSKINASWFHKLGLASKDRLEKVNLKINRKQKNLSSS
jgi:tRNA U34 5-carboxymethylaminomethyl modifying enzyme MnmG/GidA